jgi:hypothetical protein
MLAALARAAQGQTAGPQSARLPTEDGASCAEAWAYETSTALYNAVCCSRRAGKTFAAVRRAVRVLCSQPGAWVHAVSLIRRNACKHFWRPICALLRQLGWSYSANQSEMLLELSNGSWLQCLGVDDSGGTKAVQGDRSSLFIIDECHLPNDDVLTLLVDVATPMLVDTGGMLDLLGLPPEVEPSFFSDALDNPEWAHSHWDMFAHDYPRSREAKRASVEEIMRRRGLTWDHPIIKRQYRGLRAKDPAKQAYEYEKGRNDYDPATVDFDRPGWIHSAGLDLGFQDRDAIVVEAWRYDDPERRAYVRFHWQRNHLSTDSLYEVVASVRAVYRPVAWTGDHGGHGAVKVLETLSERLRIQIDGKPGDVMVSVGLVNDDLRTGRLLLPTADVETPRVARAMRDRLAERPAELAKALALLAPDPVHGNDLAGELPQVAKTANQRTRKPEIGKKGFHSDLSEAMRYAHHGAQNWRAKGRPPEPTAEERRRLARVAAARRDKNRKW